MRKRFSVFIRCENVFLKLNSSVKRCGFYVTVYANSSSQKNAEHKALNIIRNDTTLYNKILNNKSDPPIMYVENISEIDLTEFQGQEKTGYSFYEDEEAPN